VILLAFAGVLGLKRTPNYTATANVSVGAGFNNSTAGAASVIQGMQSLASLYSRVIDANAVGEDIRRRLAAQSLPHSGKLSANPVPQSPVIRVTAEAATERQAIGLANAGSAALAAYVNRQGRSNDAVQAISKEYKQAALRYRQQLDLSGRLSRQYEAEPTRERRRARDRAAAASDTARLHRDALLSRYQNAVQAVSVRPPLEVFKTATEASSDRYQILEILVIIALVGGLVAGAALALLRAYLESARPVSAQ
jgi:capsular polysaccharide biosynthesis protein